MDLELDVLEAQVLKLSAADRARLLDRLIVSLDEDQARTDAWNAVAAKRDAEIEAGDVVEVDGAEALALLRSRYR